MRYLGYARAGVLAVQQEGDPASLHLPFEEMLLGNSSHLCKLPEEDESLQTQQLTLLIPRDTSGLASGSPSKSQPFSKDHSNALVSTKLSGFFHQDSLSFLRKRLKRLGMTLAWGSHPKGMHKGLCGIRTHPIAWPVP